MTETEVWRPVLNYEGLYEVSSLGRVRGLDRLVGSGYGALRRIKMAVLRPRQDNGYNRLGLSRNKSVSVKKVAVLVCEAFHGPRPPGLEAAHEDGVSWNDKASNLSWKTKKENEADRVRHGTVRRGTQCFKCKLSEDDVRTIRSMYGVVFAKDLAKSFGVSKGTIDCIWQRRSWTWLK